MKTPLDASYMADNVLLFRYFESAGAIRQAISMVKKRTGKHEHTIREFLLTDRGLSIGNPLADFHGVLSGTPSYRGSREDLIHRGGTDA
jgi:circadian clock protein KaiC